ncbi:DUF6891 domain-containing protein [Actinoallomurus rhizosphaericola]|uniref:DUF6891 domain-containing protein n=1 Tax=Actinoallomurus rhizosphaericola TaxID=2952536 RepID=UPI00209144EA|nr:hypothetical protein [Actinoallomurus rhizosphaericola]MCO5993085.1 hypothetical protein [Actinoallomurus rhizosphaericola]
MIDTADRNALREHIREALAIGDLDFDAVIEDCVEHLHGVAEAGPVRAAAAEIAAEEFAAYRSDQESWPDLLDADRLIRAFRELEMAGIVAREDFACCQSCGTAEIGAEAPEGAGMRGYVFCHHQDVQAAVAGHGVYLAYGTFGGDEAATTRIGEEVVAVLRRHGLAPDWNGDPGRRIAVPMTWRRRRFGRLAAWPGGPEPEDAGPLTVTYRDYARGRGEDDGVPMPLAGARQVLLGLTPRKGDFATFEGRSGAIVQLIWEDGPRLWLESPDTTTQSSRGRHVTPAEAEEAIRVLADEDRADLAWLGDLEVRPWSDG